MFPAFVSFIGSLNVSFENLIKKLYIKLKPFYDLLHRNPPEIWTKKFENIFHKIRTDTKLTISNTKHPFIAVDASLIGLGAVLFQPNGDNKRKVVP